MRRDSENERERMRERERETRIQKDMTKQKKIERRGRCECA